MDNNDYRTDKVAIYENNYNQALIKFEGIEKTRDMSPITFLKERSTFVKIRDSKKEILFKYTMAICWSKICGLSGIKNELDNFVLEDISKMITTVYSDLSVEEIYKAFELERHGVYEQRTDHFQFFSSEYVSTILKKYKSWKVDMLRQHSIKNEVVEVKQEISLDEQKKIMNSAISRLYNEFLNSGEVSVPCSFVFDELWEREVITLKEYDLPMYRKIAEREVKNEVKSTIATDKSEYNSIKETLSKIESNKLNEKVLSHAKRLVLHDFFKKIKDEFLDIEELTKQI